MKKGQPNTQLGVTLIELLIGLAIGVLVILATLSLLLNMTHASARVAQTHDVSDAIRTSVSIVERAVVEAGFGLQDTAAFLSITPTVTALGHTNMFVVRSRSIPEPLGPLIANEVATCRFEIQENTNQAPMLIRSCTLGANPATTETVATGVVAFEAHSGCASSVSVRVEQYRRGDCAAGETRRSVRLALILRAQSPDPVPNRLVADDVYSFPATVEVPTGAVYTVPTGAAGVANGCSIDGECRSYKHRLLVSELIPRNELFRSKVSF